MNRINRTTRIPSKGAIPAEDWAGAEVRAAGTEAAEVVAAAVAERVADAIKVRTDAKQEETSCQDLTEVDQWVPEP